METGAAAGKYNIRSESLRIATNADKHRIIAETAFQEAMKVLETQTEESWRKALAKFEEALSVWQLLKDDLQNCYEVELTRQQVYLIKLRNKWELRSQAYRIYQDGNQLKQVKDSESAARCAIYKYQTAIALFYKAEALDWMALIYIEMGWILDGIGEWARAIESHKEALQIYRLLNDLNGQATALNSIGWKHRSIGEYTKALELHLQALPLYQKLNKKDGIVVSLASIGALYNHLGDSKTALNYLQQARTLQIELKDVYGEALTLYSMGIAYRELGQSREALNHLLKALPVFLLYQSNIPDALNEIGKTYSKLGDHKSAVSYYNQALPYARRHVDPTTKAKTLNNLMEGWIALLNLRFAILHGKQAVNVYQEIRSKIKNLTKEQQQIYLKSVESTYRKLSDILIAEGRILEAEQVLNLLKTEEFGAVLRRTENPENLLPYSAAEEDALKIIDQLAALGGQRADLLALKARGAFPAEGDARLTEIDAQIAKANAEIRRSLDALAKAAPVEFDLKQAQTLQSDLRELGAGPVALYTLVVCGDDSPLQTATLKPDAKQCEKVRTGWIILVTPDFRKAYPIDVRELNETVAVLRQALSSDKYDPAPFAKKLYDKLFRQTSEKQKTTLEADLNEYFAKTKTAHKTLMWSLDGVLRYIPTVVLHDGNSYLIEKYRSFVFTTASLTRLKDKNKPSWKIFGLGVSEARDGFKALPGVKRELLAIVRDGQLKNTSAIMPGVIRLDKDFTRQAFLEGLREGYPVVHLASHFSYKNKQEESFLLLGDSRLTLDEMRDFAPIFENVDLLTLSACNTATSDADNGKEVEGLGIVAQSLGAKAVIASLWEVSDTGTDELMKQFYKLRADNPTLSKGEAFRRAQLVLLGTEIKDAPKNSDSPRSELIDLSGKKVELLLYEKDAKKPFEHPHYWSSFVLIGNWK